VALPQDCRTGPEARSSPRLRRPTKSLGPTESLQARARRLQDPIVLHEKEPQAVQYLILEIPRPISSSPPLRSLRICNGYRCQAPTILFRSVDSSMQVWPNLGKVVLCCPKDAISKTLGRRAGYPVYCYNLRYRPTSAAPTVCLRVRYQGSSCRAARCSARRFMTHSAISRPSCAAMRHGRPTMFSPLAAASTSH